MCWIFSLQTIQEVSQQSVCSLLKLSSFSRFEHQDKGILCSAERHKTIFWMISVNIRFVCCSLSRFPHFLAGISKWNKHSVLLFTKYIFEGRFVLLLFLWEVHFSLFAISFWLTEFYWAFISIKLPSKLLCDWILEKSFVCFRPSKLFSKESSIFSHCFYHD